MAPVLALAVLIVGSSFAGRGGIGVLRGSIPNILGRLQNYRSRSRRPCWRRSMVFARIPNR